MCFPCVRVFFNPIGRANVGIVRFYISFVTFVRSGNVKTLGFNFFTLIKIWSGLGYLGNYLVRFLEKIVI